MSLFRDRADAGQQLAARLAQQHWRDPVVLALPRGGVPVAAPIAARLHAPLDVLVARKVGAPRQPEFGIGAVAEGGVAVIDSRSVALVGLDAQRFDELAHDELVELERRVVRYRGRRHLPVVTERDVILVDDGLATGVTAEAGVASIRALGAAGVTVAVPVASRDAVDRLTALASVVCLHTPSAFRSVGEWYRRFDQTSDAEVLALLPQP